MLVLTKYLGLLECLHIVNSCLKKELVYSHHGCARLRSLMNCQDIALIIVKRAESSSEAWEALKVYFEPDTKSEKCRLHPDSKRWK